MENIWKLYPQEKPSENEYYLTLHEYQGKQLIKAFAYQPKTQEFLWDLHRKPKVVLFFDKPFKWYCEAMTWGEKNLPPIPDLECFT